MKFIGAAILSIFLSSSAYAAIDAISYPGIKYTSPDTLSTVLAFVCNDQSSYIDNNDPANPIFYYARNCASGTPTGVQYYPPLASKVSGLVASSVSNDSSVSGSTVKDALNNLNTGLSGKYNTPTCTTAQYIRGDGSCATAATSLPPSGSAGGSLAGTYPNPTIAATTVTPGTYTNSTVTVAADGRITSASNGTSGTRTFNYPSRTLNSCFQISSTNDADFRYSINISALITLGGGTANITSYTNSGCTTGAQVEFNGAVSSVAIGGTSSIPLFGTLRGGRWAKITATASGGGSAAIDAVQGEVILP